MWKIVGIGIVGVLVMLWIFGDMRQSHAQTAYDKSREWLARPENKDIHLDGCTLEDLARVKCSGTIPQDPFPQPATVVWTCDYNGCRRIWCE